MPCPDPSREEKVERIARAVKAEGWSSGVAEAAARAALSALGKDHERPPAEREFLAASVAVWRHLDEHGRCPGGGAESPEWEEGKRLRGVERVAWERYRSTIDNWCPPELTDSCEQAERADPALSALDGEGRQETDDAEVLAEARTRIKTAREALESARFSSNAHDHDEAMRKALAALGSEAL